MNLPSVAVLEELYPGLSGLINTKKTTVSQLKNCLQFIQCGLRLWIIKESLYNTNSNLFINIEEEALRAATAPKEPGSFKLADWKNAFFTKLPQAKSQTIEEFLLLERSTEQQITWKTEFKDRYSLNDSQIKTLINSQLFSVSYRTLSNDFKRLHLLKSPYLMEISTRNGYKRINFSRRLKNEAEEINYVRSDFFNILDAELHGIAEQLNSEINGIQRFFIHTEYIVKGEAQDNVGELIEKLKNLWTKNALSLIKITYDSASLYRNVTRIIYPICVRYIRRASYLSAYGQSPKNKQDLCYKNYRLDRISNLEIVDWNALEVPNALKHKLSARQKEKYSPEYIISNSAEALGSDFHLPIATMLLRFPQFYHEAYIENTLRHETFKLLNVKDKKSLNKLFNELKFDFSAQQTLQKRISRFPDDAYYQLNYRVDDNDVIMRLRAWGANVEVLFPNSLRDRMIKDISETYAIYQ